MPELSIQFEVYCAACNNGLCNQTEATTTRRRGDPCLRVAPCERCIESARQAGHDDGYKEGHSEGYQEGYDQSADSQE